MLTAPDWQAALYLGGFAGKKPLIPVRFDAMEELVRRKLPVRAFDYLAGGAGREQTMATNRSGWEQYRIVPRMLQNVSVRDLSVTLFDRKLPLPVLLAPVGVLELAHPEADLAVGRAAAVAGVPFIFSNQASCPMEQVAAAMGDSTRWFQLYWSKSRELVESLVTRAEASGCSAIVVTLDTTLLGWRLRDLDHAYLPFLEGRGMAQYTSDPVFQRMLDEASFPAVKRKVTLPSVWGLMTLTRRYPGVGFFGKLRSGRPLKAVQQFVRIYSNPALQWSDLAFLRERTRLPVLLKGILHPDDARKALDHGIDGLIVSNHGGRQVDGSVSTAEVLPGVVQAVEGKIPVLVDSGIRGGADIFKALALGASAVCVGRPYAYALALGGQAGVATFLQHLSADFELTMALAGCRSIHEITRERIVPAPGLSG